MTLQELMQCVGRREIPSYSIWYGEEQGIIDKYINHVETLYKRVSCPTVADAIKKIGIKSLDKSKKMYVITDDNEYLKAEKAWERTKEIFCKSNDILILRFNSLNKTQKFYKQNKNDTVEFLHMQLEILTRYIQNELNLSDENCSTLCKMCNNDYSRIMLEVDKIKQLCESADNSLSDDECFLELKRQGAFYEEVGDITFELTNAILGGYPELAIEKLDEAKRKGEPPLRIASILYTGFRNLFAYMALGHNKQGAKERTGMTGWQIKQCIDLVGGYNMNELKRNMLLCQKVESGIKCGEIDDSIALDFLTLHCLM